jgi:hypothetical protein
METKKVLELDIETARAMFQTGNEKLKAIAVKAFPELNNPFTQMSEKELEELDEWTKNIRLLVAHVKAFNEGWEPDWDDVDEVKYFVWYNMEEGSAAFNGWVYRNSYSSGPSRLCFPTEEKAEEFAKLHTELITKVYLK